MDQDDVHDLQIEVRIDEASRDTPPNRTRRNLVDQLEQLQRSLNDFDVDDLEGPTCQLADRIRQEAAELVRAAVRFDRARDATWEEVGTRLHVTRQAAWERFGP